MSLKLSDDERAAFREVVDTFERTNIKYVVLRRWDSLPDEVVGDAVKELDIDMLVAADDFNRAVKNVETADSNTKTSASGLGDLISRAAMNPNRAVEYLSNNASTAVRRVSDATVTTISQNTQTPYELASESSYAYQIERDDVLFDMKNHLSHVSPLHGGRWRLDPAVEQQMIDRRQLQNGFYTPSPPDELAHVVTHCVFEYEGEFSKYYTERCETLKKQMSSEDWGILEKLLSYIYYQAADVVIKRIKSSEYNSIRSDLRSYANY